MDQDTIGKVADATKAAAETGSKFVEALTRFGNVIRGPIDEMVGILQDRVKFARWSRQLALADKAQRIMAERKIGAPTRELPLNFVVPLLIAAVLEEDDELQETWARLLVNAGDASTPMELRTAYVEILKGMSAFDVKNLSVMAKASLDAPQAGQLPLISTWTLPGLAKVHEGGISQNEWQVSQPLGISLGNLSRLGCAAPAIGFGGMAIFQLMTVTHLGRALYKACS